MRRLVLLITVVLLAQYASAQLTRATLSGHVTDPTGAVVTNAQVLATNVQTGVKTTAESNGAGYYYLPYLSPGRYELTVKRSGFKAYVLRGLELQTQQHIIENIELSLGNVSQQVVVTGKTPLINIANASTGEVLSPEMMESLPLNGGSPLGFAHMMFGAVAKGKHSMAQVRPFDNQTADDFSLGGGFSSSNQLLLNGVPNMQNSGRTAGFSPMMDAVSAVRVSEFDANAAVGGTAGGVVDITTKSGTNHFHGSATEHYAGSRPLEARPYFQPPNKKTQSTHYNQFGATIGGPVLIPHVYNGRNKMFFFYAYQGYRGTQPNTIITSIPTAQERQGNFSILCTAGFTNGICNDASEQLYNPYSAHQVGTNVVRDPILNNTFSNAGLSVNPVAKAYMALIPLPNFTGSATKPDGENNYYANDPTLNNYGSEQGRLDYVVSESNKIDFVGQRSEYDNEQNNYFHNILSGSTSRVVLWGGLANDIENFSPSLSLETRLGFSRSENSYEPTSIGTSPTAVGFPQYMATNATQLAIPPMYFGDTASIPTLGGSPGGNSNFDAIQLFTDLTKNLNRQTIEVGTDFDLYKNSTVSGTQADGWFAISNGTGDLVAQSNTAPGQPFGGSLAQFALGVPGAGGYTVNRKYQYNSWYFEWFAQDNWRVTPNFTLTGGVQIIHETPVVESQNHQTVGFDTTAVNGVTQQAIANYQANPNAALPVADFKPYGGIVYATSGNRGAYNIPWGAISPRFGFAYSPGFSHGTMAIRGGFAIYVNPFADYNAGQQYGYSQSTNFIGTQNNNQTITGTFSDPFPTGGPLPNPIQLPVGDKYGYNTNLGSSIYFFDPNTKYNYSEKYTLDVQKQFGHNWLVELSYMGARQINLFYSENLSNSYLYPYLSHTKTPDPALTSYFSASTPNPFYGVQVAAPTNGLSNSKQISVGSLLKPFPEFSNVTEALIPDASANFNALLLKVQKQLSNGLEFIFNYEYSRSLGALNQLNPGGPLWYGETSSDFPEHASLMAIYQLPFGRGREFLSHSKVADEIVGGWQLSGIYQYLSGTPLGWGNVNYSGNFSGFNNNPHYTHGPSFNTAGFARASSEQPNGYNYRTFPESLLRSDPTKNFDFSVQKNFVVGNVIIQPRIDAFNAFNRPQFNGANTNPRSSSFGYVTSQMNQGRQLQGGIHIIF